MGDAISWLSGWASLWLPPQVLPTQKITTVTLIETTAAAAATITTVCNVSALQLKAIKII